MAQKQRRLNQGLVSRKMETMHRKFGTGRPGADAVDAYNRFNQLTVTGNFWFRHFTRLETKRAAACLTADYALERAREELSALPPDLLKVLKSPEQSEALRQKLRGPEGENLKAQLGPKGLALLDFLLKETPEAKEVIARTPFFQDLFVRVAVDRAYGVYGVDRAVEVAEELERPVLAFQILARAAEETGSAEMDRRTDEYAVKLLEGGSLSEKERLQVLRTRYELYAFSPVKDGQLTAGTIMQEIAGLSSGMEATKAYEAAARNFRLAGEKDRQNDALRMAALRAAGALTSRART